MSALNPVYEPPSAKPIAESADESMANPLATPKSNAYTILDY